MLLASITKLPITHYQWSSGVGVVLTPIVHPQPVALADLRGKTLAVDGNGELYQSSR